MIEPILEGIKTTRFGSLVVDSTHVLHFEQGLIGFADCKRFVMLAPRESETFCWLQSMDDPDLAFVVVDPLLFVAGYTVNITKSDRRLLQLDRLHDAHIVVILNRRDGVSTANLAGPLVLNLERKRGIQMVLSSDKWPVRAPVDLEAIRRNAEAQAMGLPWQVATPQPGKDKS